MRTSICAVVASLCIMGQLLADEPAKCPWKVVTGRWTYTDSNGYTGDVTWERVAGNDAVVGTWKDKYGQGTEVAGWRPEQKVFAATGFGPGGEHWEVICPTVTETMLKGEIKSRLADGRRKTGTWQITKKSDDEMPVLFEGTVDGKQVTINASFKRVREGAQAKLAPEFVKSSDYFVGTWNTEFAAKGQVYRGRWAADWSTDKTCLISSWEGAESMGSPRGTRVQGWDPVAKQILLIDFGSDGSWSIERYTIVSDEVDEGTITGVDAEGKPYEATVRTVKKDADCFTWTVTRDGVPQENTFRRVR